MSAVSPANPATVLITRRVRRERIAEFERLMAGMTACAAQFPGHMGGFLIPPEAGEQGCYRNLFAFDTQAHLDVWLQSAERGKWLQQIDALTIGDTAMRVMSGLETWFALPTQRTRTPPPRWKMALVTWMGIFPLVLLMSATVGPVLGKWVAPTLVVLVTTGLITSAMTWLVMPVLVRLLASWLYPPTHD
ncbi:MAG: antibiotic biosynthesis monooxygenase [Rhodocyclaceae bacterium]|nr:antibiotic biosynthesis monooxygenase [Rhodocyclaceae bacterium]MBX3667168.1 antibiotic biosynthesis monooxygenase [Rhodocyclaceae bacterium]